MEALPMIRRHKIGFQEASLIWKGDVAMALESYD